MEPIANVEEIDLNKYVQVLQRRWLPGIGVFALVITSVSMYTFSLKPVYKAEGSIVINRVSNSASLTGLGENIGRIEAVAFQGSLLETQAKIVTSVPIMLETIKALNLKDEKGKPLTVKALNSKLKVDTVKGTDAMLQISYTDNDPKQASKIVNKVIDTYVENNIKENQAQAVVARKFILKQLPESERSVKQAELILRKFKEENNVVVLQQEASNAVNIISKLEENITQAEAELVQVNAKLQKLRNQTQEIDSQQAVTSADLSQVRGTQDVLAQLQATESQLKVEQTRLQAQHPTIINLEEKVAVLRNLLNDRTNQLTQAGEKVPASNLQIGDLRKKLLGELVENENQRIALERKIAKLSSDKLNYQRRARILPKLEQTQRELDRKLKASQTTYETLLTKFQEVNATENQKVANVRVVSRALEPTGPDGPNKRIAIMGGGVVGILLGIIAAFGIDITDKSLKTVKEAKELFKYTLLGVIPSIHKRAKNNNSYEAIDFSYPKVVVDNRQFPLADAYQMLQANLKFLSSDKPIKAIVVTSSVSKEGKSEVAANLAFAMSQVGRRVLLVDADLRHPVQHHIWNITNKIGLSNLIVDQYPFDEVLQEVFPNLFVLSSGVVPPNPIALLDSKRMAALVDNFTCDYDFVIFDTPALSGMADAAVLSNLVDGTLLVIRPGVIEYSSANAAKEFLHQSGQSVLGMVINGVSTKHEPDSYFYYTREVSDITSFPHNSVAIK